MTPITEESQRLCRPVHAEAKPIVEWTRAAVDDLYQHATCAYPEEGCGVVFGRRGTRRTEATRVVRGRNLATDPRRFELDPGDLVRFEATARSEGDEMIAVWHSHPDGSVELSALDQGALLGDWDQVIVAVKAGQSPRFAWYRRQSGHWDRVRDSLEMHETSALDESGASALSSDELAAANLPMSPQGRAGLSALPTN